MEINTYQTLRWRHIHNFLLWPVSEFPRSFLAGTFMLEPFGKSFVSYKKHPFQRALATICVHPVYTYRRYTFKRPLFVFIVPKKDIMFPGWALHTIITLFRLCAAQRNWQQGIKPNQKPKRGNHPAQNGLTTMTCAQAHNAHGHNCARGSC